MFKNFSENRNEEDRTQGHFSYRSANALIIRPRASLTINDISEIMKVSHTLIIFPICLSF